MLCLKSHLYRDQFSKFRVHSASTLAQLLQCLFHSWEEAEHHKVQESSSSHPFYWFYRRRRVDPLTEGLIKVWSRQQLLLACKPWNKSIQQRGQNANRFKKNPMEVKPCYVSLRFQRESGNLALEQPVGNLQKSEEAGSQTVQKQGTKVFNILWNLHLCWHISTGCFTFGVSSLSGQNGPVWKISTDPKAGGCDCTQVCSFSLMLADFKRV